MTLPSGPPGSLLLGNLTEFRADLLGWLTTCAREYGDFVPARLVFRRGFLVSDPELVADVLVRRHQDFRKVFLLRNNRLFLGQGLLTSEGGHWRRNRRWVQPAFHGDRIAAYAEVIVEEAQRWADRRRVGEVLDMQDEMATLTLPIIVRCLLAPHADLDVRGIAASLEVIQARMKQRYEALVPLPDTAWTPRNVRLRRAMRELDRVIYGLLRDATPAGLLSALAQEALSAGELRDEVMTMLFAGHETTALTLAWTWYLLSQHPAAEERLHAEIRGWDPRAADLSTLPYTQQVIKEAMRLYPPVYAFGRDAARDTEVGEHRIRAGDSVIIAPWVLHRDERFFEKPREFRPERWTPAFERNLPKFAYCPFGGGARMCLGKGFAMTEAVLILATLAQRFRPRLVPGHPVELWPTFTLRSRHGLPMELR